MRQTVIGFFNSSSEAQNAAERLRASGFMEQDIDVSTSHSSSSSSDASSSSERSSYDSQDKNTPYNVNDESRYNENRTHNTLNEDRISDRKDNDDDSFGDSIGRFFRNLFDNKDDAERYSSVGRKSSIVSVYAESSEQAERARDILDECGAFDVDEHEQQYSSDLNSDYSKSRTGSYTDTTTDVGSETTSGYTNTNTNIGSDITSDYSDRENVERTAEIDEQRNTLNPDGVTGKSIPIIEENINVGKREVESGGVRLRSRIFERPVEENLRLREERVRVERVPVDRPATDSDFETFREGEVEMTETSEVPIVNKEARVVEEVRLSKEVEQREETVRDTVRKTDVEVENLSEENLKSRKGSKKKL